MELNFKQTCPTINSHLSSLKANLEQYFTDILDEMQPNLDEACKDELVDKYLKLMYDDEISPALEELRDLNSEMRDVANIQLNEIEEEKNEAEKEIAKLEEELDNISVSN